MGNFKKKLGVTVSVVGLVAAAVTFVSVVSSNSSDKVEIRLAHNQTAGSEIADSIAKFSEFVSEDSSENLDINIYASGVLGSENEEVELVKAGILDMAKVNANTLSQFDDRYAIFATPYLFVSQDHYYKAMDQSKEVQKLFTATEDQGFIAIGYYATGARSIYLKDDICADSPEKLHGKKIRTMTSTTSMKMIEDMGGSPVTMASSEVYSALQQGIVDGAESTELALTVDGHEDLVKYYTYTEHQYYPDIYIISTKKWNSLTEEQQNYLKECLAKTNDNYKKMYNQMMDDAMEEAQEHGVHVYRDIDKTPFIEAVQPLHKEFCEKGAEYKALYDDIQRYAD